MNYTDIEITDDYLKVLTDCREKLDMKTFKTLKDGFRLNEEQGLVRDFFDEKIKPILPENKKRYNKDYFAFIVSLLNSNEEVMKGWKNLLDGSNITFGFYNCNEPELNCACSKPIHNYFYIKFKSTNRFMIVGSECIKKYMILSNEDIKKLNKLKTQKGKCIKCSKKIQPQYIYCYNCNFKRT